MQISMSRTANPYDNAHMESFFKTLKYQEVRLSNYETFDDVVQRLPHFIEEVYNKKRLHSALGTYPRRNTRWQFNQHKPLIALPSILCENSPVNGAQSKPLFRRSLIRDYKQTFTRYILPVFADKRLSEIGTNELADFQLFLLRKGLSVKTCRNIIEGSLRALYRDARAELEALKGKNPWFDLRWPRSERKPPDPFEPQERDKILEFFMAKEPFYYPWVLMAFCIGTRPGEACALKWSDVDVEGTVISINKSRNLGADNEPKTKKSWRRIPVPRFLMDVLVTLPSYAMGAERVFLNKQGEALDAGQWSKDYWARALRLWEYVIGDSVALVTPSSHRR